MPTALKAAAVSVDITPPETRGVFLAGFAPNRRSLGLFDPLEAGVLALSDGDTTVALVTLDLIGFPRQDVMKVRERVHRMPGENVLPCSTHVHSGPDTLGLWGPTLLGFLPYRTGVDPTYVNLVVTRVAEAVDRAVEELQPARLRAVTFDAPPEWVRNDRVGGARDDVAVALAVESGNGARLATLLNYAAHPETLWEDNPFISADYPGAFRNRLRELVPGVPLFFSGNLGGMLTPNVPRGSDLAGRRQYVERHGRALAELTQSALATAPEVTVDRIVARRAQVSLPLDNWRFKLGHKLGLLQRDFSSGGVDTEVNSVRLGDVQLATFPGEALPEVGTQVKREAMTGRHRLLLCLGCDELGYILDPAMFGMKLYAYEKTMSVGPESAPRLIAALKSLA